MEIRIDHYHHFPANAELPGLLTEILGDLKTIKKELTTMTAETDRLTAAVAAETTVDQSAIALLGQLSQTIRDNANSPAQLFALADSMDANRQSLADAVTANTPAAPPAPAQAPAP